MKESKSTVSEAWFMQEKDVELLKQIADICKDFRLVTISYLRRVDSWLESAWKQWGLKNFESVDEYTQSSVVKDRYKKILTHLEPVSYTHLPRRPG